ncbi:hypothetical protein ACI798_00030 [Geodermatophilus sp. SYSU D01045]
MDRPPAGHHVPVGDWREQLDGLPLESRLKALLVYELASDRVPGQPLEVTTAAVRAVATAEGLDTGQPWIDAAAARITANPDEAPGA